MVPDNMVPDIMVPGHYGTWTLWYMVPGHYGTWTLWYLDIMVPGHYGTWTLWYRTHLKLDRVCPRCVLIVFVLAA
ncbi:hypothetical protein L596_026045 [Steinernema carpocapsae]|uniref:Uncharacterized protein n=1 Tax=Steinernema carpocapsae TaxID=34508 RepID=A0A4U5M0B1_STECR|nr:hypothetical protein L596_026045 [Steinernema carpocapsae]